MNCYLIQKNYIGNKKKYIYIRMDNNELLMIVLAFVVGYMASGMMKQICGGRLVEGSDKKTFINCSDLNETRIPTIYYYTNSLFNYGASSTYELKQNGSLITVTYNGSNMMWSRDNPVDPMLFENNVEYNTTDKTMKLFFTYINNNGKEVKASQMFDFRNNQFTDPGGSEPLNITKDSSNNIVLTTINPDPNFPDGLRFVIDKNFFCPLNEDSLDYQICPCV